jgi:hypothetical protein
MAAVSGGLVLTLATGAAAVTLSGHSPSRHAPAAAARTSAAPTSPPSSPVAAIVTPGVEPATSPPAAVRAARVPKPKHLVVPTLLVSGRHPITVAQRRALLRLTGVRRGELVDAGVTSLDGHGAFTLGVDPATFRPWTPKLTAASNKLWSSISAGELTASFDMGKGAKLPLGRTVTVGNARASDQTRIGAFASMGIGAVDAVVDNAQGSRVGLTRRAGMLLSAPTADPLVLRRAALAILGHGDRPQASLLHQLVITRDAGEFIERSRISTYLHAAASRLGKPYVWGAIGPDSFDCSGLVQWSFARAGIAMPRVSEAQWLTGAHIPYADARPGDLLFWHYDPTDPTNVDHVAIYAGNGMMLVAPHTGENVSYNPVPLAHLAGVVRVDPAIAAQLS